MQLSLAALDAAAEAQMLRGTGSCHLYTAVSRTRGSCGCGNVGCHDSLKSVSVQSAGGRMQAVYDTGQAGKTGISGNGICI